MRLKMLKNCGCWYLLVAVCWVTLSLSYVQCEREPSHVSDFYTAALSGFLQSDRDRRSIAVAGSSFWKGIKATMSLLRGARKMFRSKAFTQYVKAGGRNQAEADFYSVRPSNVLDYGFSKSGMVGDRRITVILGPQPEVAIYTPKRLPSKTIEQIVDNIYYL